MESYSVTTVLGVYADFNQVRPDVLEAAIHRGVAVHRAGAAHAGGNYVLPLAPEHQGYFDSFRMWFDEYVREVIFVEERFWNESLGFNGQPDLGLVLVDGRPVVADLKTPANEAPTWKGQIAAYCELARSKYGYKFEGLSLRLRDGKPALANVYQYAEDDYSAFLAALMAYRYFKK